MDAASSKRITMGRICGVVGLSGWVKVVSYTEPKENILRYTPWLLCLNGIWQPIRLLGGRLQGKGLVAQLENYVDRDAAHKLIGTEVAVYRAQLPPAQAGSYYWTDLIGLEVLNLQGERLGAIESLFETGANDVLVIKGAREYLVPYIKDQVIKEIDLHSGVMRIDWDSEF